MAEITQRFYKTGAATPYATLDDDGNWDVIGELRVNGVAVASIDTSGHITIADTYALKLGAGGTDDQLSASGTATLWTHVTGNLTIDNTAVTGATTFVLGTDTTATKLEVQNNSAAALFSVTPASASAGTVLMVGTADLNGLLDQDTALTGTGTAADITATMSHATQVGKGLVVAMAQITNVRTSGTVSAIEASITSLTGTTAGVDHYAYVATCVHGDADSDHFALKVGANFDAIIDASSCATGEADVIMGDNLAIGWQFRESTNAYLTFVTTNDAERITVGKLLDHTVTTVDMANAAHALVLGTAGAAQTKVVGNIIYADANGGAQNLTLPATASWRGPWFIFNTGGEAITVKDAAAATIIVLDASTQHGIVASNGTTVFGFMGGVT